MKTIILFLLGWLACGAAMAQAAADRLHVVIVNGGMNKLMNHERYFNDCAFLYRTLRQDYHVPQRCFTLLMSDGGDPARDMLLDGAKGFASSPDDLDGDGQRDVYQSATLENVTHALSALSSQLTSEHHLLLFLMDHGGMDADGRPFLWMWGGGRLYASQLAQLLAGFHTASMCIVLGQCYAGAFLPALAQQGRVVMTACGADELSWACQDRCYDEFVFHWVCALAGHTPEWTAVHADLDGDGQVSASEAFVYAQMNDRRQETPQYSSIPLALGNQWTVGWALSDGIAEVECEPASPSPVFSLAGIRHRRPARGLSIGNGRKTIKKP